MKCDKEYLRKHYKNLRSELTVESRDQLSQRIFLQVKALLKKFPEIENIHLFFPIAKQAEIDTFLIKDFLEERGAFIYTSKIISNTLEMETLKLMPKTGFDLDSWGIPVPSNYEKVKAEFIQLVFIPLLVFDVSGHRVGFGKGYYDVFLDSLDSAVLKIGLSFFPPVDYIPHESHDVTMDYCITPEQIFTF